MLGRIRLWQDLAPIVQHHHEWWDGSGYPDGLSGDAIPQEARIIAVCDAFDTMTSATSYRDPLTVEAAVHELESHAGRQFDHRVVRALLRSGVLAEFEELVKQSRGETEVDLAPDPAARTPGAPVPPVRRRRPRPSGTHPYH